MLDAVRALKACWRLVCLDDDGFDDLDQSMHGFWRSFTAIYLVAPLYIYTSVTSARLASPARDEPPIMGLLATLCLLWVLWPLIMVYVSRLLDVQKNYVRYIIASNWTNVYIVAAIVPVIMAEQAGILSSALGAILSLMIIAWSLYFRWFVTHRGLAVSGVIAAALVFADLVISVFVSSIV